MVPTYYAAYEINPYGLWTIALHEYFANTVEHVGRISDDFATPHSVVDAIRFFDGKHWDNHSQLTTYSRIHNTYILA